MTRKLYASLMAAAVVDHNTVICRHYKVRGQVMTPKAQWHRTRQQVKRRLARGGRPDNARFPDYVNACTIAVLCGVRDLATVGDQHLYHP